MPAKYLVTLPPGAPVPEVGFVKIGEIFTAPEGYVPSLSFRPVNEEARKILEATFDKRKQELEKRRDRAGKLNRVEDHETLTTQLEDLGAQRAKNLKIFTPEDKAPAIEPGVTMKELADMEAEAQAQVGPKVDLADARGGSAKGKGEAKDDRKL